jgi:hypothetical protein
VWTIVLEDSVRILDFSTQDAGYSSAAAPARPRTPAKVALIVIGVSRSGTSALTRVINLLGATLPENLLPAGHGNERGFWEPRDIVELSDEILRSFGSGWCDNRPLPDDWCDRAIANGYIDRITATIERCYRGASLIVIKDPRLCRLAPLYFAALNKLRYTPRVVIPVRAPGETIASLHRRDDTDPRIAELVWVRHILETEAATRGHPRVWVSYDRLLQDWRSVAAVIANSLDLTWPVALNTAEPAVSAFIEPALRHFDAARQDPAFAVGQTAARLYTCLQNTAADQETRVRQDFDQVRATIHDLDRLQAVTRPSDSARLDGLNRIVIDLNRRIRALQDDPVGIAGLQRQLDRLCIHADALEHAIRDTWECTTASAMPASITEALRALRAESQATQDHLAAVLPSRFWDFTRPLRWLHARTRRVPAIRVGN